MDTIKIQPHLQARAKSIVDMIFDSRIFNEKLSRDDIQSIEDVLAFEFQSNIDSFEKTFNLMQRFKKNKL
jgi:hypothetical protein